MHVYLFQYSLINMKNLFYIVSVFILLSQAPQAQDNFLETSYRIPKESEVLTSMGRVTKIGLPKKMNILVWNLHKGKDDSFAQDFFTLSRKKDLIVAEEVFLDSLMSYVFLSLPNYYFNIATSFFLGKDEKRTGVATASQVQATQISYIKTETDEPAVRTPKMTIITSYPIKFTNKKLTVVNIHSINFVENKYFNKEIERIYSVIKHIPSPIIFAGDFNTWNEGRLKKLDEIRIRLNLNEASFNPDNRKKFHGNPLDHFLFSKDLKVHSAKVEEFYMGSDHKPLEIELEYMP